MKSALALLLTVVAFLPGHAYAAKPTSLTAIDPRTLMPKLSELPHGTTLRSHHYVTNQQAAKTNGTSLVLLEQYGREIGYTQEVWVPKLGDIEVEVVRFHTHAGTRAAYKYFLTLPQREGLPAPQRAKGIGERANVVVTPDAAFIEFMRGRYYVVVTAIPVVEKSIPFIGLVSHNVDVQLTTG